MGKKRQKGEGVDGQSLSKKWREEAHNHDVMDQALKMRQKAIFGLKKDKKRSHKQINDDEFVQKVAEAMQSPKKATKYHAESRTSTTTLSAITSNKFAELPISANTRKAISDVLGYENMTVVQQEAIPPALTGVDVLAKARKLFSSSIINFDSKGDRAHHSI